MISLGIYEKALPRDISWEKRLELAKELGFNFVELSKIGRASCRERV